MFWWTVSARVCQIYQGVSVNLLSLELVLLKKLATTKRDFDSILRLQLLLRRRSGANLRLWWIEEKIRSGRFATLPL